MLGRTSISVWQQCKTSGFKLGERIYSACPVEAVFNGTSYQLKAFKYTRKENGATVNKTIIRGKIGRPRKHYKANTETKTVSYMGQKRKVEQKLKPNNKEQTATIQTFNPENKVLVQIDKKTWVYRDICNL